MMPAVALLLCSSWNTVAQQAPRAAPIDDFESGIRAWSVNDGLAPKVGKPTIPQIYLVSPGAPGSKGDRAALIEFSEGRSTWASVTKSVDGQSWVDAGCTGLSLWLRGDGGRHKVKLVLRSYVKVGDTLTDTSYTKDVSLTTGAWFGLGASFSSFKDRDGNGIDDEHLKAVRLFQFVKTGSWQPLRFTADEIRAEVLAVPSEPEPTSPALLLDFDSLSRESLLQQGVCLGSGWRRLLEDERFAAKVKGALASLGRPMVRVKLSDFYVPGGREVKSADLQRILVWIRSAGGDPLLCLDQPMPITGVTPQEGWRRFGAFCADLASRRHAEPGAHYYEIGNEPLLSGQLKTIEAATEAYNALSAQVLLADPMAEVGGMGFASPWDEHLTYFAQHARMLKFLSFHFFGAHSPVAGDRDLFDVACRAKAGDLPHQIAPSKVGEMLERRSGARPEIWITECALNSAREANGNARDKRIRTHFGAAWLGALSLAVASDVDRVLWFKAFGNGWGLLNDDGSPTPAFHALSLLSRPLRAGAALGAATRSGRPVFVAPTATAAGRFVIIAHVSASSTVNLHLSGSPPVQPVRIRRVDPAASPPTFDPLSPSSRQKLTLKGPGIAIIEAPSK